MKVAETHIAKIEHLFQYDSKAPQVGRYGGIWSLFLFRSHVPRREKVLMYDARAHAGGIVVDEADMSIILDHDVAGFDISMIAVDPPHVLESRELKQ